jgi:hypothetical protein
MRDRRALVMMVALGALALCLAGCDGGRPSATPAGTSASPAGRPSASPASTAASGSALGRWLPVRSTGQVQFGPVSCVRGAAGWCTALGMTQGGSTEGVAVVATARAGVWGSAKQIPGLAALVASAGDHQMFAEVLSCPAVGDCVMAGEYNATSAPAKYFPGELAQGYLAEEVGGIWHKAVPVPGLARLNTGKRVQILSVSCASPGNCAITGDYSPGKPEPMDTAMQAFVVSEVDGVWQAATPVPGIEQINVGQSSGSAISCAAPGYCALGGDYDDGASNGRPFIASEANGTWRAAIPAPGKPSGFYGTFKAVSCPEPGECVAVWANAKGSYAFAQRGAGWSPAVAISGLGDVKALSCPAAGECVAAGATSLSDDGWAAVAAESGGRWGKAVMVPGVKAYSYKGTHANSAITDISCPAPGYCVVGGHFLMTPSGGVDYWRGLVASETAGTWGTAQVLPGLAKLDTNADSRVSYVACSAAAACVATGSFSPAGYIHDGFVAAEVPARTLGAPASPVK